MPVMQSDASHFPVMAEDSNGDSKIRTQGHERDHCESVVQFSFTPYSPYQKAHPVLSNAPAR
ncbi:hypothetical protein PSI23_10395 [Xenorhabdus sp. XENO-10]|uniref:Uncharacterized protein n=1 Tax=Xenorhabdus yunnanensis TaxID=3025878 RepID=A0ABT5LIR8_9GAMM|nr:hypothetical protein [Xenorhabdus yunnanensis]MDC9589695.1 hypothetical protein [Xenorhabdus yunnanensis]